MLFFHFPSFYSFLEPTVTHTVNVQKLMSFSLLYFRHKVSRTQVFVPDVCDYIIRLNQRGPKSSKFAHCPCSFPIFSYLIKYVNSVTHFEGGDLPRTACREMHLMREVKGQLALYESLIPFYSLDTPQY